MSEDMPLAEIHSRLNAYGIVKIPLNTISPWVLSPSYIHMDTTISNDSTPYRLTLRRRYNDRQSVFNLSVSLDAMDDYWRDELTLTKTNYAYILSSSVDRHASQDVGCTMAGETPAVQQGDRRANQQVGSEENSSPAQTLSTPQGQQQKVSHNE